MKLGALIRSIALLSLPLAVSIAAADGVSPATTQGPSLVLGTGERLAQHTFLGFGVGEERRYVLGPADALYRGEHAAWSIRLQELIVDPPHAVFELAQEWTRAETRSAPPIGTVVGIFSSGELRVNTHGFPVSLRFRAQYHRYGQEALAYTVRYVYEDGRFRRLFSMEGLDLERDVRTRRTDAMDAAPPLGMWAFTPMGLECMLLIPPSASQQADCREPLFANPGLLSLAIPTLWEASTGELELFMLTPAGYYGMPGASDSAAAVAASGVATSGYYRSFDSDLAIDARTNSDVETLRYVDRVRVDVGPRARDAWRFEGLRAFDAVYVDDDGAILRVDLGPLTAPALPNVSDPPGARGADMRELWIRVLLPSEY